MKKRAATTSFNWIYCGFYAKRMMQTKSISHSFSTIVSPRTERDFIKDAIYIVIVDNAVVVVVDGDIFRR